MGNKSNAISTSRSLGVPVVPGSYGILTNVANAAEVAERIGYPVLIKAVHGGGGKGIRIVEDESGLLEAFRMARAEAKGAFGDDRVYLEKFVLEPRHVEIQIMADKHGNVVHYGERECSVQRRHQKLVEESPCAALTPALREEMGKAACDLAKEVGYVGAGTVEFLYSRGAFYFLEMNTRLQVEHPVTEEVYGVDLVEMMLRVAAGETLPLQQVDITPKGWSIEARLYAEDSARGFLPSTGQLLRYRVPVGEGVRADSGVAEG
ncbi:MAG: ATP-grasp domain-containing protein, partial [Pseudomonadota bacterium]|nr:ATP-grasp domain-containing protein [Pseudomonadota bacterium]